MPGRFVLGAYLSLFFVAIIFFLVLLCLDMTHTVDLVL